MKDFNRHFAAASLAIAGLSATACTDSTSPRDLKTGTMEISVSTVTGWNVSEPGGYSITIDDGPAQPIGSNATLKITALPIGNHLVRLSGLTSDCSLSGYNPRLIMVLGERGGSVAFAVTCVGAGDSGGNPWDY